MNSRITSHLIFFLDKYLGCLHSNFLSYDYMYSSWTNFQGFKETMGACPLTFWVITCRVSRLVMSCEGYYMSKSLWNLCQRSDSRLYFIHYSVCHFSLSDMGHGLYQAPIFCLGSWMGKHYSAQLIACITCFAKIFMALTY